MINEKSRLVISTTLSLALTLIIGALCLYFTTDLNKKLESNNTASIALRNHMEGDMMHDALRGDVQAAILASQSSEPSNFSEVEKDLKEHAENFRNTITENRKLALPDTIRSVLDKLDTTVNSYIEEAERELADIRTKHTKQAEVMARFMPKFTELEDLMGDASDKITDYNKQQVSNSFAQAKQYINMAIVATSVAVLVILISGTLGYISLHKMQKQQELLRIKAEEEKQATLTSLANEFERTVAKVIMAISSSSNQMKIHSATLASNTQRTNESAISVASASHQAASNVSTVAAGTEELIASIGTISQQVSTTSQQAVEAVNEAESTNKVVAGLSDAAEKIGMVVQLIHKIASQTNLLALNATIEAARAGEAGKGFAVVAMEVKNLAGQTAKATEEITSHITAIQDYSSQTVNAIQTISQAINNMNGMTTHMSDAITQQSMATQEISRNAQEAATVSHVVHQNIDIVRKIVDETSEVARNLGNTAQDLEKEATMLNEVSAKFLTIMRQS